jgi:hypothetical protein
MRKYVIETDGTVEQFRFPRSQKARIRRKWQMRGENWREVDPNWNAGLKTVKTFLVNFLPLGPNRGGDRFVDEDGESARTVSSFMTAMINQVSREMFESGTRLAYALSDEISGREIGEDCLLSLVADFRFSLR